MNNALLVFNRANTLAIAGAISGTGQVRPGRGWHDGAHGREHLQRHDDHRRRSPADWQRRTTGALGTGAVINNGTLAFNRSNAFTVGNAMSGTGGLRKEGAGTTTLTGANSYSGTTTIAAGTLQVGSGSTTGTLGTGAVVNNAALIFNRSNSYTVGNAITGSGAVTKAGSGTAIFTGANTYAGTTTISAGTLQVGDGGTSGTLGSGAIVNNGTLAANRSDAVALSAISGSGQLVQAGSGTTILTADNTYTGATTIAAGTLDVGDGGTLGSLGTGGGRQRRLAAIQPEQHTDRRQWDLRSGRCRAGRLLAPRS